MGALKALVGAYVGAVLFVLAAAAIPVTPVVENPRDVVSWRNFIELITLAAAGVIALSWWILPLGAIFELVLKPRIVKRPLTAAAFVGIALGFLTAGVFALTPGSNVPASTSRTAFVVLPAYCATWCVLYAKPNASTVL